MASFSQFSLSGCRDSLLWRSDSFVFQKFEETFETEKQVNVAYLCLDICDDNLELFFSLYFECQFSDFLEL